MTCSCWLRRAALLAVLLVAPEGAPAKAHAFEPASGNAIQPVGGEFAPSRLVLRASDQSGAGWLAQRAIEREWGPSEDSIYVVKEIPGWRSEPGATLMSAVLPGSGQVYGGDTRRGILFALVEVAGWTAHYVLHRNGENVRRDAANYAGPPADSTSTWSFARWAEATGGNTQGLQQLYAGDPEAFYDLIGSDSRYLAGWEGDPESSRAHFVDLRDSSDRKLSGARATESLLWINHLTAAFDAFSGARFHNLALSPSLGFKVKSGWHHGGPELTAILERKF